jgi:hypothetical protein
MSNIWVFVLVGFIAKVLTFNEQSETTRCGVVKKRRQERMTLAF